MAGAFSPILKDYGSEWHARLAQHIEDGQRVDLTALPKDKRRDTWLVGLVERALSNKHPQVMELAEKANGFEQSYHLMKLAIQYQHPLLFSQAAAWIDWSSPDTQSALLHVCGFYHGHMFDALLSHIKHPTPWRARWRQWMGHTRRPVPLMERSSFMSCVLNHQLDVAQSLLDHGVDREQWMVTMQRAVDRNNMKALEWLWAQEGMAQQYLWDMPPDLAFSHIMKLIENCWETKGGLERSTLTWHLKQLQRHSGEGIRKGVLVKMFHNPFDHVSALTHQYGWKVIRLMAQLTGPHACMNDHFQKALEQQDSLVATALWPVIDRDLQSGAATHPHHQILNGDPMVWSEVQSMMMKTQLNASCFPSTARGARKI